MKYEECHYYEPNFKYFESCPVTTLGADALTIRCIKCRYNTFDENATKNILCDVHYFVKKGLNFVCEKCGKTVLRK